jgi:hypothetical protein
VFRLARQGDGGAAQHTQRWQYTPYACRTACAAFAQVCPVVRTESLMGERSAATLNVACRWTTHNMTVSHSSSSISSSQSRSNSSQSQHSLRPNPAEGEGLASRSCEAGLWQCHPHIAGYHTTTCQQLPTLQRESLHAAQPLSTGWVRTRHSGVDDIASAFRYSQLPRALKVEAPRRVGRSDAFRRGPNRAAPSNTITPFHTCKLAARTYEELAHRLCCRN